MNYTDTETDTVVIPRKRNDVLKSVTDRPSREPVEHPDPTPAEQPVHPVTRNPRLSRRDGPA